MLAETHSEQIQAILSKYPDDQKSAAVLPLLYLAQEENGFISKEHISEVASLLDMSETQVGSLLGFYTLLHDEPEGKYRLQICTDLPCALRGAEEFSKAVCKHLGVEPGETSSDGLFTVEEVMCIAACDKAPVLQLQTSKGIHYHEDQSDESIQELIANLREGRTDE